MNPEVQAARRRSLDMDEVERKKTTMIQLQRRRWLHQKHVDIGMDLLIDWETFRINNTLATAEDFANSDTTMGKAFSQLQPGLRDVITGILIEDGHGLETYEKEMGWPARSAKLMLRAALDALNEIRN